MNWPEKKPTRTYSTPMNTIFTISKRDDPEKNEVRGFERSHEKTTLSFSDEDFKGVIIPHPNPLVFAITTQKLNYS